MSLRSLSRGARPRRVPASVDKLDASVAPGGAVIEFSDLRCFLVLAEELHFGQTAARLRLTQPRVSQTIRRLERTIGAPLFERTSRRVRLTPLGERLRDAVEPLYRSLETALEEVRAAARGVSDVLRIGFLGVAANELTPEILREFERRHRDCELELVETSFADPLGPLRDDRADVLYARLPVDEPDLVVGPVVVDEPRAVAVSVRHRFARLASVSAEQLAHETLFELPSTAPDYWRDFHVPPTTPSGRPIARRQTVATIQELLAQVAAGRGISVMVECMPRFFGRPDVAFVPVADLPWSRIALVWRAAAHTERVRALAEVTEQVVARNGGPEAGRGPNQGIPVPAP
jgi:DNA-binding transcriptional LysR family regulator